MGAVFTNRNYSDSDVIDQEIEQVHEEEDYFEIAKKRNENLFWAGVSGFGLLIAIVIGCIIVLF